MTQAELNKRALLLSYAKRFGTKIFVETGTYRGDTVKRMLISNEFEAIHTVDIYPDRAERARVRFGSFPQVNCWCGDSAEILPLILEKIEEPALFWLDAHHSGKQIARVRGLIETPIIKELEAILAHPFAKDHIIIVDDARYYVTFSEQYDNYPSLVELEECVRKTLPDTIFELTNDIVRIHHEDHQTTG